MRPVRGVRRSHAGALFFPAPLSLKVALSRSVYTQKQAQCGPESSHCSTVGLDPSRATPVRAVPETVDRCGGSAPTRLGSRRRFPMQRLSRLAIWLMAFSLLAALPAFAAL